MTSPWRIFSIRSERSSPVKLCRYYMYDLIGRLFGQSQPFLSIYLLLFGHVFAFCGLFVMEMLQLASNKIVQTRHQIPMGSFCKTSMNEMILKGIPTYHTSEFQIQSKCISMVRQSNQKMRRPLQRLSFHRNCWHSPPLGGSTGTTFCLQFYCSVSPWPNKYAWLQLLFHIQPWAMFK